jgi:Helicase HerA, central domain/TraM recognition site of TraD and TraG
MTASEHYTNQFYTWEHRGRGWFISSCPVDLEPPYIPFFRHGYQKPYLDEGKRPTFISRFLESFKDQKPQENEVQMLDYETLDPFVYDIPNTLKALVIQFPNDRKISPEKTKALLLSLSYSHSIISFEIIGTSNDITIQFVGSVYDIENVATYIKAYFPECITTFIDTYIENIIKSDIYTSILDFGLNEEFFRPLNNPKNYSIDPLTSLFGILESLQNNQQGGIQILFEGVKNNWSESIVGSVTLNDGKSFFEDDPNAPKIANAKIESPLFAVTIRAFAQGDNLATSATILEKVSIALMNASRSATNQLIPLPSEIYDFDTRIEDICNRQSHRIGMLLNVDELSGLLHFPSENISSKKLSRSSRKTKEVPHIGLNKAFVLGENYHNSVTKEVTISIEDRLKHTHIIGATGTGKSTLIANLILQDIQKGYGLVLFDPHGDLIDDVISHIPEQRINDCVLIDPSDSDYFIGLNILKANSDIEKEILSSDLLASFRKYATSWGDQMNSVLGNAILAILESSIGGSLLDLRRFLIENEYRNTYLQSVNDVQVVYYWQKEYPLLKTNSIGPILTRLDTFLRPKSIRNMVIQKKGLDFEHLLNSNKIILLKLSQGLIGTENSSLLASLFLSKIHQAILQRQGKIDRKPIFLYLDEFQNYITPSIKEMLSGVRKYNVGLILSHQDLQQLQREDSELLNSVLGNVNNRIVLRVGEPDAKKLQDGFANFTFTDLQNLGKGEAIVRIEQPQYDCSLTTYPLLKTTIEQRANNLLSVTSHSRLHYASSKEEVDSLLISSLNLKVPITKKVIVEEKVSNIVVPIENVVAPIEILKAEVMKEPEKDLSVHRYLQTLVKKMAEQRGYIAGLEIQTPNGNGQVDVLLSKDTRTIAIEICNTTDAQWELHNISKCLDANYTTVISLSGDPRQLEKIKKKCLESIEDFNTKQVFFFTPDALFAYLDESIRKDEVPKENVIKGYRVNVTYDSITSNEMDIKRVQVAQVVMNSLKKRR